MSRRIIICADDYGFDEGVSQGILDCVDAGRVSAAGCMSLAAGWPSQAQALATRRQQADFGLHLDLNEFAPYGQRSLTGWITAAYAGQISDALARRWVDSQLDAFEQAAGFAPQFVDGHQHVHQLPVLRRAVLEAVARRYGRSCALRDCRPRRWRGAKAAVIGSLGAGSLARMAAAAGLVQNRDFAGVYDFSTDQPYGERVRKWLGSLADGGLLMTHPARASDGGGHPDAIRAARLREHAWWLSPEAGALLQSDAIRVVRFGALTD